MTREESPISGSLMPLSEAQLELLSSTTILQASVVMIDLLNVPVDSVLILKSDHHSRWWVPSPVRKALIYRAKLACIPNEFRQIPTDHIK